MCVRGRREIGGLHTKYLGTAGRACVACVQTKKWMSWPGFVREIDKLRKVHAMRRSYFAESVLCRAEESDDYMNEGVLWTERNKGCGNRSLDFSGTLRQNWNHALLHWPCSVHGTCCGYEQPCNVSAVDRWEHVDLLECLPLKMDMWKEI